MSATDKIKNTGQSVAGKVKEAVGHSKGDERLENEGRADQASADVKQAGENVKDAFKR
ncbi:CsbD family protein [Kineosporia sp. J2-2]|uniref:CsbD family protein n=1 Tax=Kineosporia corallincola TaxID=2835133 RepID=A0ABS5T8Z1_9ACTN|nr:CsbD family protein [Kineosporia corallincola]MBT0767520.1 CsbD family protein [Kineosporia corallincola]